MAGRLRRFLNLEGARRPAPESAPVVSGRFGAGFDSTSGPAANQPAAGDGLAAARRAQLESGLLLDERSDDVQPFVRCGQCGTDAARGASQCKTCGAALDTPGQRAFNEQLWAERRAEALRENGGHARAEAPEEKQLQTQSIGAEQARALGEALAAEVRERESRRLSWMGGGAGFGGGGSAWSERPLGLRLLDRLPGPRWRFFAALALAGLAGLLGWRALTTPAGSRVLGVKLALLVLVLLFVPLRRRWRNRW